MQQDVLALLRNHVRFGRMLYSRTVHMAGCFATPTVHLP